MTDLNTLANLAQVFSALTVIGGAGFALVQLHNFRVQRRDNVAAELMRTFYAPDFARAVRLILQLPDECAAADLRGRGAAYEESAIIIATTFEAIGLLVFREITPFSIVKELTGGLTMVLWRKLQRWTREVRTENVQPSFAEWFQWLAERLREHAGDKATQPAYTRFSTWRPRS
jgi:hypothetical protein